MATDARTKETQDELEEWSFDQLMLTNDIYDALDTAQRTMNRRSQEAR